MNSDFQKKAYFSGRKILKWYEYHMEDLESDGMTKDDLQVLEEMNGSDESAQTSEPLDPALEDEVSRIMANFANAHQDSVDSLFSNIDNPLP